MITKNVNNFIYCGWCIYFGNYIIYVQAYHCFIAFVHHSFVLKGCRSLDKSNILIRRKNLHILLVHFVLSYRLSPGNRLLAICRRFLGRKRRSNRKFVFSLTQSRAQQNEGRSGDKWQHRIVRYAINGPCPFSRRYSKASGVRYVMQFATVSPMVALLSQPMRKTVKFRQIRIT